jgi:benzoylformate decarboxylase
VLALQEASVIGVADRYAQATRRPALVNLHTAAGFGNALGNLVTAFPNRTPLIVTAGQQTREMLLMEPWLSNIEPENFRKPWVKWAYQPVRPQDVPATFMRAYAAAVQPPASSVFLSLPLDDWEAPALGPAEVRTVATRIAPDPSRLAALAKAIDASTHPALVFGAAVAHGSGWAQAVALAEQLDTPVCGRSGVRASPVPRNAFAVLRWIAVRQRTARREAGGPWPRRRGSAGVPVLRLIPARWRQAVANYRRPRGGGARPGWRQRARGCGPGDR